jgi:hypothetical protein
MIWQGRRQSSNVEDRRGTVVKGAAIGGGLGGAGIIITLVVLLLTYCTGGNIGDISDTLNTLIWLKPFLVLTYKTGYQNFFVTLYDTLDTLFKDKKRPHNGGLSFPEY